MNALNTIRSAVFLVGLVAFPAWASEGAAVYALGIDGLSCPFCAYGIEKELASVDGIDRVDVDIGKGVITVYMTAGTTLDEPTARKATENAGFTLRSFEPVAPE